MSQNIYQYQNSSVGLKLSLDSYDMSLSSDEINFNQEVVYSPYLIAQTYGTRLPIYFDINNTLTAQNLVLTYKNYNFNNVFVSQNFKINEGEDINCFTAKTSCDIGLTGTDNGLVTGMTAQTITFTNGLVNDSDKFNRLVFDRRFKMFQVTGYTNTPNFRFSGFEDNILYEVVSKNSPYIGRYHELYGGFYQGFYKLFGYDYEVFPERMNKGWSVEMLLKPRLFDEYSPSSGETTLNEIYPNNKDTFFYFGARAENKYYHHADGSPSSLTGYTRITEPLVSLETCACCNTGVTNSDCIYVYPPRSNDGKHDPHKNYGCNVCGCDTTTSGSSCSGCGCPPEEYESCGWECKTHICGTGTTSSIQSTCESNPLNDSMSNALSFKLSGDPKNPSICVRILRITGDCETTGSCTTTGVTYTTGYTVDEHCTSPIYPRCQIENPAWLEEEHWFQFNAVWERYTWLDECDLKYRGGLDDITEKLYLESLANNSQILITPFYNHEGATPAKTIDLVKLNEKWLINKQYRNGRLKIYINGKLFQTFENIEELIPRALPTEKEKQVGVPFNISWGGGTQGLREHLIPKQVPVCDIVGGVLIDVVLTSEILPGSINIIYTLTSSSILNEDLTVDFKHTLDVISGNPIEVITGVTINSGQTSGTTTVSLSDDYSNLNRNSSFSSVEVTNPILSKCCNITTNSSIYATPTPTPTNTQTPTNTPTVTKSSTPKPTPTSPIVYRYCPSITLDWPSSNNYTLYNDGFTSFDDGHSTSPILLPVTFSMNGIPSNNLYVGTNGYFTLGSGYDGHSTSPLAGPPSTIGGNPGDNWLLPGLENTDGDIQNVYYKTGDDNYNRHYVKLLVYGGRYGNPSFPTSWIANFYKDTLYQWLEVRAKSNLRGNAGPYDVISVAQPSSTISQVWRSDLNGQNWVYLGFGSISADICVTPTPTPTNTITPTQTPTNTITQTPTNTITPTNSETPTPTPTNTLTPTNTETPTPTPTNTETPTPTPTPTNTVTPTVTPSTTLATSGLIMDWDIQNNSSYNGTGSVITDLQGNINGEITGTISYTNSSPKYLTIDGGASEYINTSDINPYLSPVNTGTTQSIFLWIYPTSNGVIYSEQGSLAPDFGWFDVQIQRDSSDRFLFGVWPYTINGPAPITSSLTHSLNNWYYVGWTYNGTTLTAYVNGTMVGISTYSRETPYNDGGSLPMYFNFGYPSTTDLTTTTTSCSYRLGGVQIYNVGLTSGQVLQNFNTTKTNYGI